MTTAVASYTAPRKLMLVFAMLALILTFAVLMAAKAYNPSAPIPAPSIGLTDQQGDQDAGWTWDDRPNA